MLYRLNKYNYAVMEKKDILKAIKNHLGFTKEKDFAKFLGVAPSLISTWYARNSFDIDLIMKKCDFINPNWLLNGQEPMLKNSEFGMKLEEKFDEQLENKSQNELQKELDLKNLVIELQKKLIDALEEKTKELEQKLKSTNNKNN